MEHDDEEEEFDSDFDEEILADTASEEDAEEEEEVSSVRSGSCRPTVFVVRNNLIAILIEGSLWSVTSF